MDAFIVAHNDSVTLYNVDTFKKISKLPINCLKSDSRESVKVMSMGKREDLQYISIITGQQLVMSEDAIS